MTLLPRRIVVAGHAFRLHESTETHASDTVAYVLVHGVGMSHRYLVPLHEALSKSARVISIDLPGFAGLPQPERDLEVPDMGRLLAELVAVLGLERVVYVGHSMGAQWVLEAARADPRRVEGVVLIGPVVDERHRTLGAQARALMVDTLGESPAANGVVLADYLRCGIRRYLKQARRMVEYSTASAVRAVRMPVLVIRGGDDPVAGSEWAHALSVAARDGELIEIPGQQHNVQFSAPRAVAGAIERWTPSAR
jgi:pimeloyl-ACP methyl ester carboxylesterase